MMDLKSLNENGYATFDCASPDIFEEMCATLGRVVLRSDVKIVPQSQAMVFTAEPIEWHQDSTQARYMAWYCVDPGAADEATEFLPIENVIKDLPEVFKQALASVQVVDRLADGREVLRPLMNEDGSFYYCPWLIQRPASGAAKEALANLQAKLRTAPGFKHSWKPGSVFIIDNHRCLHRRPRLGRHSQRHLIRLWLENTAV